MRKLFLSLLALLLITGVAFADSIQTGVEPKNSPAVWTQTVYNNHSAAIASGYIVAWDFANSNDTNSNYTDILPWVVLAGNDGVLTAGVMINDSCAVGDACEIVVKGPYLVYNTSDDDLTANQVVASGADGAVEANGAGANTGQLGVSINTVTGRQIYTPIYVDPQAADE